MRRFRLVAAITLVTSGCSSSDDRHLLDGMAKQHLPQLVVGQTSLDDVSAALGPASSSWREGRVRAWKIVWAVRDLSERELRLLFELQASDEEYPVTNRSWIDHAVAGRPVPNVSEAERLFPERGAFVTLPGRLDGVSARQAMSRAAEYHLVCVFDDRLRLERHALVRVGP